MKLNTTKLGGLFFSLLLALHAAPLRAAEGEVSFSVSPESAYSLLDETIRSATRSIELNIYMLTNRSVMEALVERAGAGVKVTVLLEGEVFGGEMLLPVKNALDDFQKALRAKKGKSSFLVMTGNGDASKRRFAYNHAKYMIVDGRAAFLSSENITGSAFSPRNWSGGTRGWQVVVEDRKLAQALGKVFAADSASRGDVVPYEQAKFKVKDPGNNPLPPRHPRSVNLFPVLRGRAEKSELCLSPKSLECMLAFIRSAKTELLVQHMNLPLYWVNREGGAHKPNPLVHEILAAARRGVKVRVLLNDDDAFGDKPDASLKEERNDLTVAFLKGEASKYRIRLEAATFRHKAVQVNYVHNKGMVADGKRVFVSSINGTENSVMNNREVAVALDSVEAGRYFAEVFSQDWTASTKP